MPRRIWPITIAGVVAACSAAGTSPAPPASIASSELETVSSHVLDVVLGHAEAWAEQDIDRILSYWDEETVHEDTGFNQLLSGDALRAMPQGFFEGYPNFQWRHLEVFVARESAIDVTASWGVTLKGIEFTEDASFGEVDRVEVDSDGTIGRWTLFYDLETWERWSSPPSRLEDARRVIEAYRVAWASGDPAVIEALYAGDAERVDTLLGTGGSVAETVGFAADLAAAYPDAVIRSEVVFTDSRQTSARPGERVGAVFGVQLGADPSDCVVRFATLLTLDGDSVTSEEVFWDADSLTACGWAA